MRVVATAADAGEAIRVTEELQPDLLVLDADLPGADAATLRASRARLGINIVLLNVDTPHGALRTAGLAALLPRSASTFELIAALRGVAEGREQGVESPPVLHEAPTAREIQVLRLVQEGLKNRAIAERLQTSERTVQFHLTNVFAKLNAASRTEAVHLARKYGWLD